MKIVFLAGTACARNIKEGLALIGRGHQIVFLHQTIANWDMLNLLPVVSFYNSKTDLALKLRMFEDIDLIHVHNEPSWLGPAAKEARPDLPLVFDAHDLNAVRYKKSDKRSHDPVEREALAAADGVIFPSEGYRDFCLHEFHDEFPSLTDKPCEVVYSMCNQAIMQLPELPRIPGVVYQGGVNIRVGYRDYRSIARGLTSAGIPFHLYGADMNHIHEYAAAGALCMPTLGYKDLIRNLSRYDWGFVGSPVQSAQWDRAMSNKMFEYIAAGIPCLVFKAQESARFIDEHQLGLVVKRLSDIPKSYDAHEYYRRIVREKRERFTMESQVSKIEELYRAVLQ